MNNIQKRILSLESEIQTENYFINQQYRLFKEFFNSTNAMPFILISSFVFGFVLAQKKTIVRVISGLAIIGLIINRLYKI